MLMKIATTALLYFLQIQTLSAFLPNIPSRSLQSTTPLLSFTKRNYPFSQKYHEEFMRRINKTKNTEKLQEIILNKKLLKIRNSNSGLKNNFEIKFYDSGEGILHFSRGAGIEVFANTSNSEITLTTNSKILLASQTGISINQGLLTLFPNSSVICEKSN